MSDISDLVQRQREAARSKDLLPISKRVELLKKLEVVIKENSEEICEALKLDLGKSEFESYLGEIDFVLLEIKKTLKHISKWSKAQRVGTALTFFPVRSYIQKEPYGTVLVIGPWNYPFQLLMAPVAGALAAGNTVVIKPSEISSKTSNLVYKLITDNFDSQYLAVVEGAVAETTELLDQYFDYIFYTGNGTVGRIIMEKASKNLTPITLELGGKSPCLVYSRNLDISAKRIVWGKFFNAGQTCVAPDYIMIAKKDVDTFVAYCQKWLEKFYSSDIKSSPDYGRIINERHFERLTNYLNDETEIILGGDVDKEQKYIAPTLVKTTLDSKIMSEEIFGPILPIIEVESLRKAIDTVKEGDKPLAAYAFLDEEEDESLFTREVSAGGMVINDTLIHLSNDQLPFGGIGESGMGCYHGRFSFDTFSHSKAVMKRYFALENDLRYPPYEGKLSFIRKVLEFFG